MEILTLITNICTSSRRRNSWDIELISSQIDITFDSLSFAYSHNITTLIEVEIITLMTKNVLVFFRGKTGSNRKTKVTLSHFFCLYFQDFTSVPLLHLILCQKLTFFKNDIFFRNNVDFQGIRWSQIRFWLALLRKPHKND